MKTRVAVAVASLVLVVGCGNEAGPADIRDDPSASSTIDTSTPEGRLSQARADWAAGGPSTYRWRYERICFCPPLDARIDVEDGRAVGAVNLARPKDQQVPEIATMEDLFDLVEDALGNADKVSVKYDDQTGAVRELVVDVMERAVDDEYTYKVRTVTPG